MAFNAKVAAASLATAAVAVGAAVVWLFFLVLAMNGFSERQARPVFVGHFLIAGAAVVLASVAAGWGAAALPRRFGWNGWAASLACTAASSLAAVAAIVVAGILLLIVFAPG